MPDSAAVILLRIEELLRAQLERMAAMHTDQAALHSDISKLLAVLVHKTQNGALEDERRDNTNEGDRDL
jgi:hypothetical protein